MNIFLTSYKPQEAARHLDDLRLNKMILETAQLLSNGYRQLFGDHSDLYRTTHVKHPCSLWVCKNIENYSWLVNYFDAVAQEKYRRDLIKKSASWVQFHKSWRHLFEIFHSKCQASLSSPIFDFNCTEFPALEVRAAYQKQLVKKWLNDLRAPQWTGCSAPEFWQKN